MTTDGTRLSHDEPHSPPNYLATLLDVAISLGLAERAVLEGTGLERTELADPETLTSTRQLMQACRNLLRIGAPAHTAFEVGSRLGLPGLGLHGYAFLTCPTLGGVESLRFKYQRHAAPIFAQSFRETDGEAVWRFESIGDLEPDDPLYRFLLEMQFAHQISVGRDVLGPGFELSRVNCRYPAPADLSGYQRALGCPAQFGRPVSELRYAAALLDVPAAPRSAATMEMAGQVCERLITRVGRDSGVTGRVFRLLLNVPGRFDDMETIAARLNTTSRTLRRKLQAENTSFQQLLAETRCELAKDYLKFTRMSTEDLADALGFSDAANFRHAFRRWTGRTTGTFRR